MRYFLLITLFAFVGCVHPTPPTPPIPVPSDSDAGVIATCSNVCLNLHALGCPEGFDTTCTHVCEQAQSSGLTDLNLPCLVNAKTVNAVRLCRSVDCR